MPARISKEERENQIAKICEGTPLSLLSWDGEYKNAHSRVFISCKHHGPWSVKAYSFINLGSRCPACAGNVSESKSGIEKRILDKCEDYGFYFNGWSTVYKNCVSKIKLHCSSHGEWKARAYDFLSQDKGCPGCKAESAGNRCRMSQSDVEEKIMKLCSGTNYKFVAWDSKHESSYSKFICNCKIHGNWSVRANDFINAGRRCQGCAETGFNTSKDGVLYALRSACGSHIKIGISNNFKRRIYQLKRATPFEFHIIEKIYGAGTDVRSAEKYFHKKYQSAGLSGFDGCTEWLLFDHSILDDLRNPVMISHDKK